MSDTLKFINNTPQCLSILYDLNLLPEQTLSTPSEFQKTVAIADLVKELLLYENAFHLAFDMIQEHDGCLNWTDKSSEIYEVLRRFEREHREREPVFSNPAQKEAELFSFSMAQEDLYQAIKARLVKELRVIQGRVE